MENSKREAFLVELPGSDVREIHGSRLMAATDLEVAFAMYDNTTQIVEDLDSVIITICDRFVDSSKGEGPEVTRLGLCLALLDVAMEGVIKSDDINVLTGAKKVLGEFVRTSKFKNMM